MRARGLAACIRALGCGRTNDGSRRSGAAREQQQGPGGIMRGIWMPFDGQFAQQWTDPQHSRREMSDV